MGGTSSFSSNQAGWQPPPPSMPHLKAQQNRTRPDGHSGNGASAESCAADLGRETVEMQRRSHRSSGGERSRTRLQKDTSTALSVWRDWWSDLGKKQQRRGRHSQSEMLWLVEVIMFDEFCNTVMTTFFNVMAWNNMIIKCCASACWET